MNPVALIIGANGQDGTLLSHYLRERGYTVIGVVQEGICKSATEYIGECNILSAISVDTFFSVHTPDQIYYLAAHHHSSQKAVQKTTSEFTPSLETHVSGLVNILEGMLKHCPEARLFYASSSLIFGKNRTGCLNETSCKSPACAYGITKKMGMDVIQWYRERYNIFACSGILFNHESWLRSTDFLSRKIIQGAVAIAQGKSSELVLGNLGSRTDWGYAPDFVDAFYRMLRADSPKDYVIATGHAHSVQDWIEIAFGELSIDWRSFVRVEESLLCRTLPPITGNIKCITEDLGWRPTTSFSDMVHTMLQKELNNVTQ